ncbi:hypothetical protein Ancab_019200 [Ancistrocladus abbreviatus]
MLLKSHTSLFLLLTFSLLISSSLQQGGYNCKNGCCGIPFGSGFCSKCCASVQEAEEFKATVTQDSGGLYCKHGCCGTWVSIGRFERCTKCCASAATKVFKEAKKSNGEETKN